MYFKLMKIFFKENFSLRRLIGTDIKKNKGKAILIGLLLVYALGAFLFTFGFLFFDLADVLNQFGLINILLIYGFIYGTMLSIMYVLFRANGYLFNYKDYEILEPLPIRSKDVILAKTTVMMVFIYFSIFIFLAPIMFSYFYHGGFNLLSFILLLIGILMLPVIPLVLFSFVSLLIARITSKFRKSNILNVILLVAGFLGIMYLSISIQNTGDVNPLLNQQEFMDNLGKVYPPVKWFVEGVHDHNILSMLWLVLSHVLLFIGFIFGIQKLVTSTNQRGLSKVTRKSNKKAVAKERSILNTIVIKETRTFFNTPIYVFNIGFGPLIMIVLAIASLFFGDAIQNYMAQFVGAGLDFEIVFLIIIGFSMSMVYSTAVSLSLEGKNFWILKSLPINPKTIMHGKMLFNIYLGLPAAIISMLIFSFNVEISMARLFLMVIVITTVSFAVTSLGSIINLYVPKFEYRNPTEVVKQSAGAMLGIFGGFGILILDGLLFYFVSKSMSLEIGLVFIILLNLALSGLFFYIVNKKSESIFINFEV